MNRRKFMQGMLAGIATVAIASKLAPKFPQYIHKKVSLGYTITEEEIDDGMYGEIANKYAQALAKSMSQSREISAANVLNGAFT